MIIGIDFDNTIVCYDEVLYRIAFEKGLIPENVPKVKDKIRNYLRQQGMEQEWIKLQGIIYGPDILYAKPFDGVVDFLMHCRRKGVKVFIISHKTLHPFLGEKYNLHEYAHLWLKKNGFYDNSHIGLEKSSVFFELTKREKIERIIKQGCTHYIDDLPEFLEEAALQPKVVKILFDPSGKCDINQKFICIKSWKDIIKILK